ncbi:MAG: radical SAM protein [bacterium]|nr:radical SAM protein [bacterium]
MSTLTNDKNVRYGFYGRLSPEFPSQIIIDSTELCNLACIHCPHPTFKQSEHYAGRSQDAELNKKIVDEVREHGKGITQYIRYTGEGEPLLHRYIYEMIDYAVKNSGTMVTLTTNGTLLTPSRIEKLLDTGVNVIDISTDAFKDETYEKIRVNGDLKVVRQNILNLIKRNKERGGLAKIILSFIEQPQNHGEGPSFEQFWKEAGADYVVVRRLHSGAGAVKELAQDLVREADSEQRTPCLYPWERIIINPRGELVFCPQDWVHGSVIVDYRTTTIKETWQSNFYKELREAHMCNKFENHAFCGNCPDWKQTRWPDEGRSYANMVEEFKNKELE